MAIKIYIDQGHNPVNPNAGAEGQGYREQDIVYRIGVILESILERRGYDTRLSRKSEDEILGTSNLSSLAARVNEANAWGADYFISLHTNASSNRAASGSEALVYNIPSTASELAEEILVQLKLNTGLADRGVTERRGLYVLRKTKMPATLLELGFITNPTDASLMANSPELFAQGIADGISQFLSLPTASLGEGSYNDFITENGSKGELKVQAYLARGAYPVPRVSVVVSKDFDEGERIFFSGETNDSGVIDGIVLPAPPRINSLEFDSPDKVAVYKLKATKEGYEAVLRAVEIFDGVKTIQPIAMQPSSGGEK